MPGMEGSPVYNFQNQLIALLLPPLLSRVFRAEVRSYLVPLQHVVLLVLFEFSPGQHLTLVRKASFKTGNV